MKWWVLRYLVELWNLAFSRLAPYQRFIGLIIIAATLVGATWLNIYLGLTLLGLLAFFFFFVGPARLWHQMDERLRPRMAFIEHENNNVEDTEGLFRYARVTVKNCGADLLTEVKVKLLSIDPLPHGFFTLEVPLSPMYAHHESQFPLQPGAHQTVDLLSSTITTGVPNFLYASICHEVVNHTLRRELPLGTYRIKLRATANEALPTEQWFKVELSRQKYRVTLE
jgi:hypothetical protein